MSPLVTETKRILREQFGKSDTDAHWMAANNWTDHGRLAGELELARKQALSNLDASPPKAWIIRPALIGDE